MSTVRSYSAVFTIEQPDETEEEWAETLAFFKDHFDTQWAQTVGSGMAWTVTIHEDDLIPEEQPL